jgi:hypothetical protein
MRKSIYATVLGLALAGLAGDALLAQPTGPVTVPSTMQQAAFAPPLSAGTLLIQGVAGTSIYVTAIAFTTGAGSVVTWIQGEGGSCATNQTNVTGAMTFAAAGSVFSLGDGNGAVWVLAPGKSLCVATATATIAGSIAWARF